MSINHLCRSVAILLLLLLSGLTGVYAQRVRVVNNSNEPETKAATPPVPVAPAPSVVSVKYEGGVMGYPKKLNGSLRFDDTNKRLLFREEKGKIAIFIPYNAVQTVYTDTKSRNPTAANVIGRASLYTLPALLIRTKSRYLTIQYDDPISSAYGLTSFKIGDANTLASLLVTLGEKAGLTRRLDAYLRPKGTKSAMDDPNATTSTP